jgi:septum formation protein
MTTLILASSSPYRKALLERLQTPFFALSPGVDETLKPGETPLQATCRLAYEKARTLAEQHPDSVVIGSDQLCEHAGRPLGKPETLDRAIEQLQALSGQTVVFHTALCVLDGPRNQRYDAVIDSEVEYRTLSLPMIRRYLEKEPAFDCAGAAKIELLGISLVASVRSEDPTALMGLPLIKTVEFLNRAGFSIP